MGVVKNVGFDRFPQQGEHLDKVVEVCFNYDTSRTLKGRIVRDDVEEPYRTIIELDTDPKRYILATECQYRPLD